MLFKESALIGISLAVYVLVWLVLLCVYFGYVRFSKKINVHTTAVLYSVTVFARLWGWFGTIFLMAFLSFTLPRIAVVTQDQDRTLAYRKHLAEEYDFYTLDEEVSPHDAFYCDYYYFPFRYKGIWYPHGDYIHNATDSVLNIYKIRSSFTGTITVDQDDGGIFIQPGQIQPLEVDIDCKFQSPWYSKTVSADEVIKETYVIDTQWYANEEKARIRQEVENREKRFQRTLDQIINTSN